MQPEEKSTEAPFGLAEFEPGPIAWGTRFKGLVTCTPSPVRAEMRTEAEFGSHVMVKLLVLGRIHVG